ncbi:hypothetical protein Ahy_B06g082639 [Arachis hypogaea]|uniref:Uncharacterized protein n=1 Tax=Arachis hypogaea TaxID=3818 RepID=A0A444YNW5_ARAHY|nr:hypothetical protein Ahy_B06g082639 [Arachis hypogaea]
MGTIAEAVNRIILSCSSDQGIPLEECGGSTKDYGEEESMEPQGEEEGLEHDMQQEGESRVLELEERKGELREIDQDEDSIIDDFLSSLIKPLNDPNEPLPIDFERDMEVDFLQPPYYNMSDWEEEVSEEGTPVQEHIEWVAISPMSFIGPHQYGILETDYQLKIFLRLVHGGGKGVGCQVNPRFSKKIHSRLGVQAWCEVQLGDFRRMSGCYKGKLRACPSSLEHRDQQEREWETRTWDPGGPLKTKLGWRFKEEWKHKPP